MPAYLVRGDDPALVAQATHRLIEQLVGDRDPSLVVEEFPATAELDAGAVVDACTTPPFLVDRRVVVVRDAGRLGSADAGRLVAALADPLPAIALVLVAGGGTVPQALVKAVGEVVDTAVRAGKDRTRWVTEQVHRGPVRLDPRAVQRLDAHLGEDLGRLAGLLETLAAAYGAGATVGVDELEPFLGAAGSVPPWELTDAIDAGDAAAALRTLQRMMSAGGRAALEVLAILHRHFSQLLQLDGADVTTPEDAAALLAVRSPFVAKKALAQARQLGGERTAQAILYLADADLDVRGRSGLPPEAVLEVLVARLSRLARVRSAARSGRR